jgi:SprT protein
MQAIDNELLISEAEAAVISAISQASEFFNHPFIIPEVNLKQRGKIAGTAHLQRNLIKLNCILYAENRKVFTEEVIPHEVAHIVCFQRFGKVKPHGKEWQQVMRSVFNLSPEVTHSLDVKNVGLQQFEYRCECPGAILLSSIRHNKVRRGKQQYRCRTCKAILVEQSSD